MEVGVRFSFAHKIPGGSGRTEAGNPAVVSGRCLPAIPKPRLSGYAALGTSSTQAQSSVLPCPPTRLSGQVATPCFPG
jgi:hypothetical protein